MKIERTTLNIALLVDGDNASAAKLCDALIFASGYGQVIVKRIYGDWSKPALAKWKEPAREYSFRLVEALSFVSGKNTSDIMLAIDAMDLLHSKLIDGFCIVSSDSDYTPLAQRIQEEGLLMLGYGESKTPAAFVNSCRKFIFSNKEIEPENKTKLKSGDSPDTTLEKEAHLFDKAYLIAKTEGKEEATLSQIGMAMKKLLPKYKPRRYGCKTLGDIYNRLGKYEVVQTGQKGIYNVVKLTNNDGNK